VARTAVVPTVLVRNGSVLQPAGTTIDAALVTAGVVIAKADFKRTFLEVTNSAGSTKNLIIGAGAYPQASQGKSGALTLPFLTTEVRKVYLDSARFVQNLSGDLWIDFEAGFTGNIKAFKLPK
jgi:hypothetical protein